MNWVTKAHTTDCLTCSWSWSNHLPPSCVCQPAHKLNAEQTVAVSNEVFWIEDMTACPRGCKVQLLGIGGVATYGTYDGKDPFWVKWQSVPRNRPKA